MRACARVPVRVDPAGGGTDAPPFCVDHGGAVVNFAVRRHVFASAQRLKKGSGVFLWAMDLQAGTCAAQVAELRESSQLEFVKAFVLRLVPEADSLLLMTEADVPPGSGLGGSGALGVAIVAAIDRAYGRDRSALETAALANEIERYDLGYPGGDQDSYGTALGGINFLQYHQGGGISPGRLQISDDTRHALEHQSLLVYSGAAHVSATIHEDIRQSYALENSPTVRAMAALRKQAQAMATALEAGSLEGYGTALSESCRQLYNLHDSCDSAEHRRLFEALDETILAGKTCGAGGGGCLLLLTKPEQRAECVRRVEQLGGVVWPVTIDDQGLVTWNTPPLAEAQVEKICQLASGSA